MTFFLGYLGGLLTAICWLIAEAFYEAHQIKKRRVEVPED